MSSRKSSPGWLADGNWVAVQRSLLYGRLFHLSPCAVMLYFWMYLRARFEDGLVVVDGDSVFLDRGQVLVGCHVVERELHSRRMGFTRSRYRNALKALKAAGETAIDRASSGTIQATIVTILRLADLERDSESDDEFPGHASDHDGDRGRDAHTTTHPATSTTTQRTTNKKDTIRSNLRTTRRTIS
jgi:hypothetical protein